MGAVMNNTEQKVYIAVKPFIIPYKKKYFYIYSAVHEYLTSTPVILVVDVPNRCF